MMPRSRYGRAHILANRLTNTHLNGTLVVLQCCKLAQPTVALDEPERGGDDANPDSWVASFQSLQRGYRTAHALGPGLKRARVVSGIHTEHDERRILVDIHAHSLCCHHQPRWCLRLVCCACRLPRGRFSRPPPRTPPPAAQSPQTALPAPRPAPQASGLPCARGRQTA